jgi:hypothetical protein
MADTNEEKHTSEDLSKLKCSLEKYRELLLPLKKILEWEQNYYPAILVGVITVIFALVWYLEPSVLSTVCILGIILSVADYAIPTLLSSLFKSADWTVVQERQFDAICARLLNAQQHINDAKNWLRDLKANKPKMYLLLMIGVFSLLAWFGSLIDNLLLTYLFVVSLSLVPGLRKRGILQQITQKVKELHAGKPKTN